MYAYQANALRVIDGDSLELLIDLGFHMTYRVVCRLEGIDAPEIRTPDGIAARSALAGLVLGKQLVAHTKLDRREKYGRPLVTIDLDDGITVNQWLVAHGYARVYDGGPR